MKIVFVLPFTVDGRDGRAEKALQVPDGVSVPFRIRVYAGDYEYTSPSEDLVWDERRGFVLHFGETLEFSDAAAAVPPATALQELRDPRWGWTVYETPS